MAVSGFSARRSRGRQGLAVAAMTFAMLLAIGVSIPANAVGRAPADPGAGALESAAGAATETALGHAQNASVPTTAGDALGSALRDGVSVTVKAPEPLKAATSSSAEPSTSGVLQIPAPGPVFWPTDVSPRIGHGVSNSHHGQDLLVAQGTPVHAIAAGTVLVSATEGSYGLYVVVQSSIAGHTVTSLYAHLESQTVAAGQTVAQGQTVGLVGSSGAATGYLLYLRILQDGALCDTVTYIAGDPAGGAAPH